jgi:hypothetical protein
MRHRLLKLTSFALLLAAPTLVHAQKTGRTVAPTMEALLKQTGEAYRTNAQPGRTWYLVNMINNGKGAVMALSEEREWLSQPGLARGRVEAQVVALKGAPTPQLLKAVAAFNDKLPYGHLTVDESGIFYIHDFIMNGMLVENLATELGIAFLIYQSAQKEFSAYVE